MPRHANDLDADIVTIYVLNGPNLNAIGAREPHIYGTETLDDVAAKMDRHCDGLGVRLDIRQSNHEGHLIDWLYEANAERAQAVLLNAGALTHTSVGLYDAIRSIQVPVIEVHLSNPHAREEFRHTSFVGRAAIGTVSGFGSLSYLLAIDAAASL